MDSTFIGIILGWNFISIITNMGKGEIVREEFVLMESFYDRMTLYMTRVHHRHLVLRG